MSARQLRVAARLAGLADPEPLGLLQPLLLAGVLEAVDLHVTAMVAARFGELDPAVLLAASLAIRAPRHGHVCVDLLELERATLSPEAVHDVAYEEVELPEARQEWLERVAKSPLVRGPGPGATPLVLRGSLLYTDRYFAYEASLEQALRARFSERREVADPDLLRRGLHALFGTTKGDEDRQRLAAQVAMGRGVTVISGGPGTGKTWTVRNLLTLVYAQACGQGALPRIALTAPTGKAAARVVSSIRDGLDKHLVRAAAALPEGQGVDGLRTFLEAAAPSTLHRLLGWRPDTPTRFRHNRSRPLPLDLLVVDEASMVDLALMAKLFDAVPESARVVLLGDRHQLASVEAGSVLGDVCGSGEQGIGPSDAVVFLNRSRRFDADSGIGRFAAAAVSERIDDAIAALPVWGAGEPSKLTPDAVGRSGGTLGRLEPDPQGSLPSAAARLVIEGYRPYLERLRAGRRPGETLQELHADALRRFDGFRVLCAHRRGRAGVKGVGGAVVDLLAEAGMIRPSGSWWMGRPVIVTTNDYSVRRFNGDVGIVVRDDAGEWVVAFPADGGTVSWLSPVRLPEHETVFAMTIHKSQGSEFADVLLVLPETPSSILTRELIYTGVTRATTRVTVLSAEGVLRAGLERRVQRASGLGDLLWARR